MEGDLVSPPLNLLSNRIPRKRLDGGQTKTVGSQVPNLVRYCMLLAKQCKGITRRGSRCSLSSATRFIDSNGQDITQPLKSGCDYCLMHLPLLVTTPRSVVNILVLYIDFETSGLDVMTDHIVEIGLLSEGGQCFSTVIRPPDLKPGPHVHGIDNEELCQGPCFHQAFARMIDFVQHLQLVNVETSESSEDELKGTCFKQPDPEILLVAHNGRKFDFPFLLSECFRNSLLWDDIVAWTFVDSLDVVKAADAGLYGGCQKLQCLLSALAKNADNLQAHRALDC